MKRRSSATAWPPSRPPRHEAGREKAQTSAKERLQERGADLAERAAEAERIAAAQQAARLEKQANDAKATADAIDPEER